VSRRRAGSLLPIEREILEVGLALLRAGHATFHGFGIAQTMRERAGSRQLTAHGTLYKALGRLEASGLLASQWEETSGWEGRPRRRLYRLTGDGVAVAEQSRVQVVPRSLRAASEPA
jgi:PadR family transcriptional regulator, regulatory protein PadR